eukprot:scaffold69917_cov59-Attheya_sp.AAC.2
MSATFSWFKTKGGRAGRRILSLTPLKNSFPHADHQAEDAHSSDEDDPFAMATDSLGRGGGVWNGGGLGGNTSPTIGRGTTHRKKKGHQRLKSHAITDYDYKDKIDSVIRKVLYHDRDHVSVMFQMHGSVWPQVLPFCIFNIGFTFLVYYLKVWGYDITSSTIGHKFMSTMSCRELVHHMNVLTMHDRSEGARQWRQDVAYRTILLLRVTIAAIDFQTEHVNPNELPELATEEQEELATEEQQSEIHDGSFRAPVLLAFNLRKEIMKPRAGGILKGGFRHPCNEEFKMLDYVTDFMKGFQGLKKLITTPFPFPLVQMTRTFLFLWVFTLPTVICYSQDMNRRPFDEALLIFFITYGFIGLEYVAMELDDPFGEDPNDFDDLGMAQLAFEDIYIAIYKLDGDKSAHDLRKRIANREEGTMSDMGRRTSDYLLTSPRQVDSSSPMNIPNDVAHFPTS